MKRNIWKNLLDWKDKKDRKPLIIHGARQIGKSYILKKFGQDLFNKYYYLDFDEEPGLRNIFKENLQPNRIIQDLSVYFNSQINIQTDLLIFDEIQLCPRAITSLKYFFEKKPELAICSAGSLLGISMSQESSFPVGKVEILYMYPMNFEEFLCGIGEDYLYEILLNFKWENMSEVANQRFLENLRKYFIIGGLPEVIDTYRQYKKDLFTAFTECRKKQEQLLDTYNRDIAKHSGKINAMLVSRLWNSLPEQLAKETDGNTPRFMFKDIVPENPGVNRYSRLISGLDWLEKAGFIIKEFIIEQAKKPLYAYKKYNMFKLYMFDIGLLGALGRLNFIDILNYDYGSYKGYFAENFTIQELACSGMRDLFCWKKREWEVDFLYEINGKIIPIEVKSGTNKKTKSLNAYREKYNPEYSIVLSANNFSIDKEKNIYHVPLYLANRVREIENIEKMGLR